ncbi:MAG: Diaminopimelate decarboxylase [Gammaproteobacteria bacterium]|nr:Diaminopimelate decarboxylase [Gammaproteobacteria bacterium]
MNPFEYGDGGLYAEEVPLSRIAEDVGTPCYVYSRGRIEENWKVYNDAFGDYPHRICYAVKANGTLAILGILAGLGSGFDIVSGGELRRVEMAGGALSTVVFSGVGKTRSEVAAAIASGVACIDVESPDEIDRVSEAAVYLQRTAPIAVRVNPDVDPDTHPYIATGLKSSKFGIGIDRVIDTYRYAAGKPGIEIAGVACHIGSQLMDTEPLLDAFNRLLDLVDTLQGLGINIRHVDAGGGLGIGYGRVPGPDRTVWIKTMVETMGRRMQQLPIIIEPGRSIVGDAGVLLTRVEYLKTNGSKRFAVVDAGMNDLLRPALYGARHDIITVKQSTDAGQRYDVVGPVCESADVLGTALLPSLELGDLIAVKEAGAYGSAMASNYNARLRPAEVVVDGGRFHLVRQRETFENLVALEALALGETATQ